MTKNPVYTHPEMTVNEARTLMDRERISRLPVLDRNGKLEGILTRKDLIKASPSAATSLDIYEISYLLSKLKVDKIMERNVITVGENEVAEEAARIMVDRNISCLPVMRGELLVGIITSTDLFRVFINAFGARNIGVRVTVTMDDRPGQIAALAGAIAQKGGNIVSLITSPGDDLSRSRETLKIDNISRADVEALVGTLNNVQIEDIR
jgi:acetoin utilization protein AcuB